jgi:hypothetical protein
MMDHGFLVGLFPALPEAKIPRRAIGINEADPMLAIGAGARRYRGRIATPIQEFGCRQGYRGFAPGGTEHYPIPAARCIRGSAAPVLGLGRKMQQRAADFGFQGTPP